MPSDPALPYRYSAYGCNFLSDLPLVRLKSGTDPALDTVTVRRADELPPHPDTARERGPHHWAGPNYLSLNVPGVLQIVAIDGHSLLYRPAPEADDVSVQLFLMGSGLGAILMQRKLLVLHGNAVEMGDGCVVCIGPSGVGKSTTAAGLMQRGHRIMSDDICAIDGAGNIVPGMPHIKLWQHAADGLGLSTEALDPVMPRVEKFGVPLEGAFCDDRVPIRRIYLLSSHDAATVTCTRLNTAEKFDALRQNTYRLPFVDGMNLNALHFQQITALSKTVTVSLIQRPSEGFHLDQLLDRLISDASGAATSG